MIKNNKNPLITPDMVIPSNAEFVVKGSLRNFQKKYNRLNFIEKLSNPTNPELKLRFKGFQIKFHTKSLLEIKNQDKTNQ